MYCLEDWQKAYALGLQGNNGIRNSWAIPAGIARDSGFARAWRTWISGRNGEKISNSICYFSNAHLLFDRDFDLTNQLSVMIPEDSSLALGSRHWVAVVPASGLPGSPYAIGYSLLGIPFLATGAAIDALTGGKANGYGPWAERIFAAANIVYLLLGLLVLHRWLVLLERRWKNETRNSSAWATVAAVALVPSTALGYYAFTVMSHTTSFMAVSLFLLLWWMHFSLYLSIDYCIVSLYCAANDLVLDFLLD